MRAIYLAHCGVEGGLSPRGDTLHVSDERRDLFRGDGMVYPQTLWVDFSNYLSVYGGIVSPFQDIV